MSVNKFTKPTNELTPLEIWSNASQTGLQI